MYVGMSDCGMDVNNFVSLCLFPSNRCTVFINDGKKFEFEYDRCAGR